jgi:response regulator RpfG family c-di-GMP phosphodiesterase
LVIHVFINVLNNSPCNNDNKKEMKPVILTVDDDPQVLRSVEPYLRSKYGNRFRVLRADSGLTSLEILKQLKLRNEPPALLLVDQRMPQMTGVEFLEQAMIIFSDAKRVLLTAYADTDAVIRSINKAIMLVRADSLSKGMSQYLADQTVKTENIQVWLHLSVVEVKGENKLEAIIINDAIRGEKQTVPPYALFIFIGAQPHTEWLAGTVKRAANEFILTGPDLTTDDELYYNNKNIRPKG